MRVQRRLEQRQHQRPAQTSRPRVHLRLRLLHEQIRRPDLRLVQTLRRLPKREVAPPLPVRSQVRDQEYRPARAATVQEAERTTARARDALAQELRRRARPQRAVRSREGSHLRNAPLHRPERRTTRHETMSAAFDGLAARPLYRRRGTLHANRRASARQARHRHLAHPQIPFFRHRPPGRFSRAPRPESARPERIRNPKHRFFRRVRQPRKPENAGNRQKPVSRCQGISST